MEKFDSLCWNITGKCNENCKFCYRRKCPDRSLEDNKKIFDNINQMPIKKISFCGGEPTLYAVLFDLVRYIREKNGDIKLSITTNGKSIDEKLLNDILFYFDWISFPIDATDSRVSEEIGRGYKHLDKIIQLLEMCNGKINLKVNTVATNINKNDLENIYHIISSYDLKRWKIFRFFPARDAKNYKDLFYLSDEEARNVEALVQKLNEESSFKIEYNNFEDEPACFSIQPDGSMEDSNNQVFGNLYTDSIFKMKEIKSLEISNFKGIHC